MNDKGVHRTGQATLGLLNILYDFFSNIVTVSLLLLCPAKFKSSPDAWVGYILFIEYPLKDPVHFDAALLGTQ